MDGEQAFRAIVEHVADGIVVVSSEGEVLYANPAAGVLLGESRDELIGDRFGYPVSPGEHAEIDLLRPQGERRVAEMRAAIIDWDGEEAYVAAVRDITARAATERSLRDVVSTVSHEVRSPLAVVSGLVDLILETAEEEGMSEEAVTHLCAIGSQVERMERLANDLLTFARIDAGQLKVEVEDIDLEGMLSAVCEEFRTRGMEVGLHVEDGAHVRADPHHVRRILDNYLSNADKYGEPPYRIEAVRDGGDVVLRVVDHGPGVPEDLVPRLFERFSRGGDQSVRGTGLGLPIVLGLARTAGGDAWYEPDAHGGGATFAVRLPCEQA
jgi:signal transduction histidine kinase